MSETKQKKKITELGNKFDDSYSNFEAKQNLLGFFSLLLKIDVRNNPHFYKNNENNRGSNSADKTE